MADKSASLTGCETGLQPSRNRRFATIESCRNRLGNCAATARNRSGLPGRNCRNRVSIDTVAMVAGLQNAFLGCWSAA